MGQLGRTTLPGNASLSPAPNAWHSFDGVMRLCPISTSAAAITRTWKGTCYMSVVCKRESRVFCRFRELLCDYSGVGGHHTRFEAQKENC